MIKKNKALFINKIATYDIETIVINNVYYPFSVGIFIDNKFKYFYLSENDNIDLELRCSKLIHDSIQFLIEIHNIKNYIIYVHNLGKFDSIFILKYFNIDIELFFHNGCIYKLKIKKNIQFYDSLKILNKSLKEACASFNIENKKKEIDYKLFIYDNIFKNEFKNEIIEYLKYDCLSLYEIMYFFVNKIYKDYGIKCSEYLTLASLSFKIWKKKENIFLESNINSNKWKDVFIRQSYFGGRCEIFKPFLENGYYYDVNSLYPFIMKIHDFPIGIGTYIKWNTDMDLNDFFGFLYCEIKAPKLYFPVLPYRDKNNNTFFPIGSWKGVYFIAEILLAIKHGYTIKPLYGIKYDKKNIFNDFIDEMYNNRLSSKNDAEKTYYKLLMNSLSGKFAMKEEKKIINILNTDDFKKIKDLYKNRELDIYSIYALNDNLTMVEYEYIKKNNHKSYFNSHVQISSAITSYARCYMYKFLDEYVYYTDTDSIVTTKKFQDYLVSNKTLGLFKLEFEIKEAYFTGLKCYYIETQKNDVIIKFKSLKNEYNSHMTKIFFEQCLYSQYIPKIIIKNYLKIIKKWKTINVNYTNTVMEYTSPYSKRVKKYKRYRWINTIPITVYNST